MRRNAKQPSQKVLAYLLSERQWKRRVKIRRARAALKEATEGCKPFWNEVLEALGVDKGKVIPSTNEMVERLNEQEAAREQTGQAQ